MSFCPVCGAHHDPGIPCADRAGELLRDAGIKPKPMGGKELRKTIKEAHRSLLVLLIVVFPIFLVIILLSYFGLSRVDPEAARSSIKSGYAWLEKGNFDRAIADFSDAIASGQLSAEELLIAYYYRSSAWGNKEDYDKAIADYSEAIRLDPKSADAYYSRGMMWHQKGDFDKAIADFSEAIKLSLPWAAAYMNRGVARFNKGEFSSAVSDLERSQQIKSDIYAAIWLYLSRVRGNSEGKAELTLNTRGMEKEKWPAPVVALYLGEADSDTVASQAADPDPKTNKEQVCEANFYLGEWYLISNRKQQARTLFTKALNDCPRNFYEYIGSVSELERLR